MPQDRPPERPWQGRHGRRSSNQCRVRWTAVVEIGICPGQSASGSRPSPERQPKRRARVLHDDRSMSLVVDVRQAARSYLESPGSAAVLLLTIGVGAGGDAAILAFAGGFNAHVAASLSTADRLEFARVRLLLLAASG